MNKRRDRVKKRAPDMTFPLKYDLLLTADWHLREEVPVCRTDDYLEAQARKVDFIIALAMQHKCPIVIAGDVGNKPRWPHWLECWLIELLTEFKNRFDGAEIIVVPGQHDMPHHRLEKAISGSGLGVLFAAEVVIWLAKPFNTHRIGQAMIYGFPFEVAMTQPNIDVNPVLTSIALAHQMVIFDEPLWPGQQALTALDILERFPDYKLIVTGDNHKSFVMEYEGRLLVNPGGIMRMTADQVDHKPCVYLWSAKTNTVETVYLPIEEGVVSREHIERSEQRNERIEAFISRLKTDWEIGYSFEENLERFASENQVRSSVMEIVRKAVQEEEKNK